MRKIRFCKQFLIKKSFNIWKSCIRQLNKNRSYASVSRLSLLANESFCSCLRNLNEKLSFNDSHFNIVKLKCYTFISLNDFLQQFIYKKKIAKYEEFYRDKYTQIEIPPRSFKSFIENWRNDLQSLKSELFEQVSVAADILLDQCKKI